MLTLSYFRVPHHRRVDVTPQLRRVLVHQMVRSAHGEVRLVSLGVRWERAARADVRSLDLGLRHMPRAVGDWDDFWLRFAPVGRLRVLRVHDRRMALLLVTSLCRVVSTRLAKVQ